MVHTEELLQRSRVELIQNAVKKHGSCLSSQISAIIKDEYGVYISPKEIGHLIKNSRDHIKIDRFKVGRINKYRVRK